MTKPSNSLGSKSALLMDELWTSSHYKTLGAHQVKLEHLTSQELYIYINI